VTLSREASLARLGPAARVASLASLLLGAASCGEDSNPELTIFTAASWNRDPETFADIGYQVGVDFGWRARSKTCFPLPVDLKVTLNDREIVPAQTGDCEWDLLVWFNAVDPGKLITVRVKSGAQVLGEATYDALFPGFGAQLLAPSNGRVRAGDPATITLPVAAMPAAEDFFFGIFYWLDTPATLPPFYTLARGSKGAAPGTVTINAPAMTGRAIMVVGSVFDIGSTDATSCIGFSQCQGMKDYDVLGPIPIEVIPPMAGAEDQVKD
jgi:hypothetical protein